LQTIRDELLARIRNMIREMKSAENLLNYLIGGSRVIT
jgi:hypothetical protein